MPKPDPVQLVDNVKKNIVAAIDDNNFFLVSMLLNTIKVYRYRYKYNTEHNEVSFNFGKSSIIINYSYRDNTSSYQVLTNVEENEDDYNDLFEIKGHMNKYDTLSIENKNIFSNFFQEIKCPIDPALVFDTFQKLFDGIISDCEKNNYGGYY
jgi:hypothetical protein